MRIFASYALVATALIVTGCSNDNFNPDRGNPDVVNPPAEPAPPVDFSDFLLDIVDPVNGATAPQTVADKQFNFPQDEAAFAGLFPADQ